MKHPAVFSGFSLNQSCRLPSCADLKGAPCVVIDSLDGPFREAGLLGSPTPVGQLDSQMRSTMKSRTIGILLFGIQDSGAVHEVVMTDE